MTKSESSADAFASFFSGGFNPMSTLEYKHRPLLDPAFEFARTQPAAPPGVKYYGSHGGLPLSDIGLQEAVIEFADGEVHKLEGVMLHEGMTVVESVLVGLPEGACLYLKPTLLHRQAIERMKLKNLLPIPV